MSKHLLFALAFVLTIASRAVWADRPPKDLMAVVAQNPVIHDDKCEFQGVKGIECLILYDSVRDLVWLVLYDEAISIYMVVVIHKKQEYVIWCRSNACI